MTEVNKPKCFRHDAVFDLPIGVGAKKRSICMSTTVVMFANLANINRHD